MQPIFFVGGPLCGTEWLDGPEASLTHRHIHSTRSQYVYCKHTNDTGYRYILTQIWYRGAHEPVECSLGLNR